MTARRAALALAALVLLPALIAGCSLLPGGGGNTGDNGAATSGPAPEDDGDGDDAGDGGGDPNAQVPATFPSDVPLIDGDVLQSADLGTGWVVLFGVDDALASFTEGADALAGAGFTEDVRTVSETEGFANYTSDEYVVQLTANVDYPEYGQAVSYTVVIRE